MRRRRAPVHHVPGADKCCQALSIASRRSWRIGAEGCASALGMLMPILLRYVASASLDDAALAWQALICSGLRYGASMGNPASRKAHLPALVEGGAQQSDYQRYNLVPTR